MDYKPRDDWEEKFQEWKTRKSVQKKQELPHFKAEQTIPVQEHFSNPVKSDSRYKIKVVLFVIMVAAIVLLEYFMLKTDDLNTYLILTIALFALSLTFFLTLFAYKAYERSTKKISPYLALAICYAGLLINMLISPRIYSIEWAFLGFVIIAIILYDFKIDSRFLILPALLTLGYIPFLLLGAQKEIAETVAVYVYYFLIVGVALQITEQYKKTENSIDFDKFIDSTLSEQKLVYAMTVWGILVISLIFLNRFYSIELIKWSSVYIFFVLLISYLTLTIKRKSNLQ